MRAHHRLGLHPGMLGDREQQRLVRGDMVEHAGEEGRIGRGLPDSVRPNARQAEEPAQPLGVLGEESERLESQDFPRIPAC